MMERRPLVLAAAWMLPLASLGCGAEQPPISPPLVLLIEIDSLRADFFGDTPFLDGLKQSSLVMESAHSTAPWTQPSLGSQFTGKWPWQHGATQLLSSLGESQVTLAEAFADEGWRTGGVSTNFLVKRSRGYAQGFELWDESLAMGHEGSSAESAVDQLLASFDALAGDEPVFLFGLFFEPHWRYEPDEATAGLSVTRFEELGGLRAALAQGELTAEDLAGVERLYQAEVERLDRALGRLAEGLQERGVWDTAVVVLTADHGEYLGEAAWSEEPWIGHTVDLSETLVRVPLWIRAPGVEPRLEARPVSQVDLGATLLDLGGLGAEFGTGHSLLSGPPRERLLLHVDFEPALARADSQRKRALMWGVIDAESKEKWVVDHLADGGPLGMRFDVGAEGEERLELGGDTARFQTLRGLVPEELGDRMGGEPVVR